MCWTLWRKETYALQSLSSVYFSGSFGSFVVVLGDAFVKEKCVYACGGCLHHPVMSLRRLGRTHRRFGRSHRRLDTFHRRPALLLCRLGSSTAQCRRLAAA